MSAQWKPISRRLTVTAALVAVNILLFLPQLFSQRLDLLLYELGALGPDEALRGGQYYRILTAMFLHADVHHLSSNMIILYFVGIQVEQQLGRISFLLLYLFSGAAGNMVSLAMQQMRGENFHSIGASGAVFGIVGAMVALAVRNRRYMQRGNFTRMMIGVFYSLYLGFLSSATDNAAHIGGFVTGLVITAILSIFYL